MNRPSLFVNNDLTRKTNLMLAAENGDIKNVKSLLPYEAGLKDIFDKTALMYLCSQEFTENRAECVRLLILYDEAGLQDNDGKTALMHAIKCNRIPYVKLLKNIEARIQDKNGKTALMYAAEFGHILFVRLLKDMEARIQDKNGKTALMYAAMNCRLECIELLLDKENDILDNTGKSALRYAVDSKRIECITLFVQHDPDMSSKNIKALIKISITKNWTNLFKEIYNSHKNVSEKFIKENLLFLEITRPYIVFGSFIDILNRIIKQPCENYEKAFTKIINLVESNTFPLQKLASYVKLNITKEEDLLSCIKSDFPLFYDNAVQIIEELKKEEKECCVCLGHFKFLYRNCTNCACFCCGRCWRQVTRCPQCNLNTIRWKKYFDTSVLSLFEEIADF